MLSVLNAAVDNVDDLVALVPTLKALGRRHVGYGVCDEHYDAVGQALLGALHRHSTQMWTPAAAAAWTEAYRALSGVMRRAGGPQSRGLPRAAAG